MDLMRRKALLRQGNVMENGLKAGSLLLAIGLIGGLAMQPGFAKTFAKTDAKTHHARGAAAEGASTAKRPSAIRATPIETLPADSGDTAIGGAPSRGGVSPERARGANATKSTAPGNYRVRRITVPGPSDTVPRNSIGVTVVPPPKTATTSGSMLKLEVPLTRAPQSAIASRNVIAKPMTTASTPSRGKIDGAGLIRPSTALSGLGGPAKTVAGINGTTVRPKH
jgi:hypothetical protein